MKKKKKTERWLIKCDDLVFVVSPGMKDELVKAMMRSDPLYYVPNRNLYINPALIAFMKQDDLYVAVANYLEETDMAKKRDLYDELYSNYDVSDIQEAITELTVTKE